MIEVVINGKAYQIGCSEEDKSTIKSYAEELNNRIINFKQQDPLFFMGLNDERILLFQSLMMIGELREVKKIPQSLQENINFEVLEIENKVSNIGSKLQKLQKLIK